MQHRIVNLDTKNIQVFAKNMLMISKKDMINKTLQNIGLTLGI